QTPSLAPHRSRTAPRPLLSHPRPPEHPRRHFPSPPRTAPPPTTLFRPSPRPPKPTHRCALTSLDPSLTPPATSPAGIGRSTPPSALTPAKVLSARIQKLLGAY